MGNWQWEYNGNMGLKGHVWQMGTKHGIAHGMGWYSAPSTVAARASGTSTVPVRPYEMKMLAPSAGKYEDSSPV